MEYMRSTDWDKTGMFWRKQRDSSLLSDTSLRSITPHIVRSRLTLFSNVLIDQKQSLAIHNVRTQCTLKNKGKSSNCGAIHFGFCQAVEDKTKEDVKSQVERLEILDRNHNYVRKRNRITTIKITSEKPIAVKTEITNSQTKVTLPPVIIPIKIEDQSPPENDSSTSLKNDSSTPLANQITETDSPSVIENGATSVEAETFIEPNDQQRDKTTVSVSQSLVAEDGDPTTLEIPLFYYPLGQPRDGVTDNTIKLAERFLSNYEDGRLPREHIHEFTKAAGLPKYWAVPIFHAIGANKHANFNLQNFTNMWKSITSVCHDDASRFVKLLARSGKNWLEHEDFIPIIQDVVDTHPGLQFLQEATDFHSRYIHCVITRIFYVVNTNWSGRITIPELRRSNLLQTIVLLEEEDDINQITDYFSYEHFYVIYCKFWELDKDHDLFIDHEDLARHEEHALSSKIIERIFSGAVKRSKKDKMSYTDFVSFILSEVDKKTDKSIEYWFRCMDLDGDGIISMFEMEHFYTEQMQRMEEVGIEPLPFNDLLCQMLDMIAPRIDGQVSLADLKGSKQAFIFFDTMFNLEKYLDHEQRDPFSNTKDNDMEVPEPSDWERFARNEYEILVAEESNEANDDQGSFDYEDDFETENVEEEASGFYPTNHNIDNIGTMGRKDGDAAATQTSGRRERPKSAKSANSEPQDS